MNIIANGFFILVILIGIIYLAFKQQINVLLFPDDYVYILMEEEDKMNIWIEKIKDRIKFNYKEGVYFFDKPEERPIRKELFVPKPMEQKNELQEIEDNTI